MGKNFSANNCKGLRKKSDFYETPYSMTEQLLKVEKFEGSILEPSSGKGAIMRVLEKELVNSDITGYDLVSDGKDFLEETGHYDNVVTNPPFSLAFEFILKAKKVARHKFAMLLPLSYLHGQERYIRIYSDVSYGLMNVHVFTRYPMLGEELRLDGKYNTGMMVYAWYVWLNGYCGNPSIKWIDNNRYVLKKGD